MRCVRACACVCVWTRVVLVKFGLYLGCNLGWFCRILGSFRGVFREFLVDMWYFGGNLGCFFI